MEVAKEERKGPSTKEKKKNDSKKKSTQEH